jgi:hypothetical protein
LTQHQHHHHQQQHQQQLVSSRAVVINSSRAFQVGSAPRSWQRPRVTLPPLAAVGQPDAGGGQQQQQGFLSTLYK